MKQEILETNDLLRSRSSTNEVDTPAYYGFWSFSQLSIILIALQIFNSYSFHVGLTSYLYWGDQIAVNFDILLKRYANARTKVI